MEIRGVARDAFLLMLLHLEEVVGIGVSDLDGALNRMRGVKNYESEETGHEQRIITN